MKFVVASQYIPPREKTRDSSITEIASRFGGTLHSTDEPPESRNIELWFEFPDSESSLAAMEALRTAGEHATDWGAWDD
jgi:hypothetical protein